MSDWQCIAKPSYFEILTWLENAAKEVLYWLEYEILSFISCQRDGSKTNAQTGIFVLQRTIS